MHSSILLLVVSHQRKEMSNEERALHRYSSWPVAWLKTHAPALTGTSDCYRLSRSKGYAHLGIWFRVLEDALIPL